MRPVPGSPCPRIVPVPDDSPKLNLMFYKSLNILNDSQLQKAKREIRACLREEHELQAFYCNYAKSAVCKDEKIELLEQRRTSLFKEVFLRSRLRNVKQRIHEQSAKKRKTVGERLLEQAEKEKKALLSRSAVRKLFDDDDVNEPKRSCDLNKDGQQTSV
ncbi:unnamed protein product [Cylicocyclus nassatus]|uniref:Uncharacterized protein n=1 Tax=Cylicocyclus nassatus TaxID=53992 RepID=A0AA36HFK3_CYLNA|nr:unnamed protein product [Cylicocyclus nassatus]